ncbi:MAG: hypothetical protein F9K21_02240 [Rhodocyclaceae bacterium]|nr:MAG: hypothetical protein F9K21_02240 [Rhodocyclaceae bacterium]MBE7421194.1 hypothetical protein [Zoogloeaceae bacterium]
MWKLVVAAGLALGLAAGGSFAADSHRHDHGAAPAKLELNNGKKWETDAPLRRGMENVRNSIDAVHHEIHGNKLSAARYAALARKVSGEVDGIVANCKLEPMADAQLHLVIAEILDGVEAMEGKAKKVKRQAGALKVGGALEKYASHFDHPGWRPLEH